MGLSPVFACSARQTTAENPVLSIHHNFFDEIRKLGVIRFDIPRPSFRRIFFFWERQHTYRHSGVSFCETTTDCAGAVLTCTHTSSGGVGGVGCTTNSMGERRCDANEIYQTVWFIRREREGNK